MKTILIITQNADKFFRLAKSLRAENSNEVLWADSAASARSAASALIDLIIIDGRIGERTGMDIAKDMIRVNALAQLALVSTLSPEEFHEAAEGLGVLSSLPLLPDEKDAEILLNALAALSQSYSSQFKTSGVRYMLSDNQ